MRLLKDDEKKIYEDLMKGVMIRQQLKITKPPEGFEGWQKD